MTAKPPRIGASNDVLSAVDLARLVAGASRADVLKASQFSDALSVKSSAIDDALRASRIAADTAKASQFIDREGINGPGGAPVARASLSRPASAIAVPDHSAPTHVPSKDQPSVGVVGTVAELGHLVRRSRDRLDMSQQALADVAGVGRRFVSELENGKESLEFGKVLKVARAVGIVLLADRS